MTAGKGMQHSEMFPLLKKDEDNTFELFQIWLNLPSNKKFVEPAYKMLWNESIPKLLLKDKNKNNIKIDIVAGNIGDSKAPSPAPDSWAADPQNEVAIWQIVLDENASWEMPVAFLEVNRSLYFFEGETIKLNEKEIIPNHSIELDARQKVVLQNGNKKSRLLLLQGKPINEAVVQNGPFVMNNQAEIQQAFSDFHKTRFGGWPWSRNDVVHGKEKGRFARFENGDEITK
jgi:redox-sensitive bicupin YhaK (pirin superfamily)